MGMWTDEKSEVMIRLLETERRIDALEALQKCPACEGDGTVRVFVPVTGQFDIEICTRCEGTGKYYYEGL